TDLADSTELTWNKEKFKLWVGDYGLFLYRTGELKASENINKYMTRMFPGFPGPYLQLADTYFDLGRKDTAKGTYKKYIELMKVQKRSKEIPKRVKERSR